MRYWAEIGRLTGGLVRVRDGVAAPSCALRALTLFRFGRPTTTVTPELVECRFAIVGGLLAKEEAGSLDVRAALRAATRARGLRHGLRPATELRSRAAQPPAVRLPAGAGTRCTRRRAAATSRAWRRRRREDRRPRCVRSGRIGARLAAPAASTTSSRWPATRRRRTASSAISADLTNERDAERSARRASSRRPPRPLARPGRLRATRPRDRRERRARGGSDRRRADRLPRRSRRRVDDALAAPAEPARDRPRARARPRPGDDPALGDRRRARQRRVRDDRRARRPATRDGVPALGVRRRRSRSRSATSSSTLAGVVGLRRDLRRVVRRRRPRGHDLSRDDRPHRGGCAASVR